MKIESTKQIKVSIKGNDAKAFKSLFKKISEKETIGFKTQNFDASEMKLANKINDKLK